MTELNITKTSFHPQVLPNGLTYLFSFISDEEEKFLLSNIDNNKWLLDLKRRTQHYGFKYDYTKKRIDESMNLGHIPEWLTNINQKLLPYFSKLPDQIIVNEYLPGQGIAKHIDCIPCFGPIVASLSLLSPISMEMDFKGEQKKIWLEPKSLLLLEKDARFKWLHSIAAKYSDVYNGNVIERQRRISLTFRTVLI